MRNKKGQAGVAVLFVFALWAVLGIGWILNIVKLTQCDFQTPYKAEIIRGIGVVTPIGSITGYLNFGK